VRLVQSEKYASGAPLVTEEPLATWLERMPMILVWQIRQTPMARRKLQRGPKPPFDNMHPTTGEGRS